MSQTNTNNQPMPPTTTAGADAETRTLAPGQPSTPPAPDIKTGAQSTTASRKRRRRRKMPVSPRTRGSETRDERVEEAQQALAIRNGESFPDFLARVHQDAAEAGRETVTLEQSMETVAAAEDDILAGADGVAVDRLRICLDRLLLPHQTSGAALASCLGVLMLKKALGMGVGIAPAVIATAFAGAAGAGVGFTGVRVWNGGVKRVESAANICFDAVSGMYVLASTTATATTEHVRRAVDAVSDAVGRGKKRSREAAFSAGQTIARVGSEGQRRYRRVVRRIRRMFTRADEPLDATPLLLTPPTGEDPTTLHNAVGDEPVDVLN